MSYVRAQVRACWAVSLAALAILGSQGCKRHPSPSALEPASIEDGGEQVVEIAGTDAGPDASPEESAPHMIALSSPTPIFSAPEWPPKDPSKASEDRVGVIRLGSLRKGQSVPVKRELVKKSSCLEGWYELLQGGFVCGKYGTLDPNDKALANAPHAPLTEGPLPYEYGLNLTNGTPLYRRAPLRSERAKLESLLAVGKNAKVSAPTDGETPWYLKPHEGDRPNVSLEDLRGETNLIEQRMVRGFYLALDVPIKAFSGKFWRTTRGMLAPADHILVHKPTTEFEGVKLDDPAEPRKLPLGFVTGLHARKYTPEETRVRRGEHVDRFTIVGLTGKKELREERTYYETTEGWWLRDFDGNVTRPGPPPSDLKPGEKWIDVNLTRQSLVAFEGDKPVYATLISSGRHDDNDKAKDHRTPMGSFTIREKHVSATMDDDSASDGPYSIEDVPWIMYFKGGIALHGAFWHSRFGHERSHGCVNLTPHDAKHLFEWAGPTLPPGWHGVHATDGNPGTRVIVHD